MGHVLSARAPRILLFVSLVLASLILALPSAALEVRETLVMANAAPGAYLEASDGFRLADGPTSVLQIDEHLPLGAGFATHLTWRGRLADGDPATGDLHALSLRATTTAILFSLGKEPLPRPAALLGDLLEGREAAPRWTAGAWSRDGLSLGRVDVEAHAYLSYLDDERRRIADPLVFGHGLGFEPLRGFELELRRTILFGGDHRTSRLKLSDLWKIFWAIDENRRGPRSPRDSDQRAAFRAALEMPPRVTDALGLDSLRGFWLYGGEDALDGLPSAVAHHYGWSARRGPAFARVEFAETVTGANRWYDHTIYGPDAYSYRGLPLGFRQGGDARVLAAAIDWRCADAADRVAEISIEGSAAEYGVREGVGERRRGLGLGFRRPLAWNLETKVRAAWERRLGDAREPRAPAILHSAFSACVTWRPPPLTSRRP